MPATTCLGVEGGQDLRGQAAGQSGRSGPHRLGDPVGAELTQRLRGGRGREQVEPAAAVEPGAEQAFQGGVDVQQGVAQPVGQPGGLSGEVVVVAGEHGEFGQGFVVGADPAQGVRHAARGLGDDVSIAGVGLALSRVQVDDPAHHQLRKVGYVDTQAAGDRDGRRADRGRLIDHRQHPTVLGERGRAR
nr:hypothetical protein [Pseudonocardia sp. ICBG1142]